MWALPYRRKKTDHFFPTSFGNRSVFRGHERRSFRKCGWKIEERIWSKWMGFSRSVWCESFSLQEKKKKKFLTLIYWRLMDFVDAGFLVERWNLLQCSWLAIAFPFAYLTLLELPCRGTEETKESEYEAEGHERIDLIGITEYEGGVIMNVVVDGSTSYWRLSFLLSVLGWIFGDQSGHFEY